MATNVGGDVRSFFSGDSVKFLGKGNEDTGVKGGGPRCFKRCSVFPLLLELALEIEETLLPEKDVEDWKLELKLLLLRSGNEDRYS